MNGRGTNYSELEVAGFEDYYGSAKLAGRFMVSAAKTVDRIIDYHEGHEEHEGLDLKLRVHRALRNSQSASSRLSRQTKGDSPR
jgi:hypothetical protein